MKDVNKVILIGHLGGEPIQRTTKNGYTVVNFSVATSRKVRPPDEENTVEPRNWVAETQWHRVVVWGKQAEHCAQYLHKGHGVYLEGSLRSHDYVGKDGTQKTAFEIIADDVRFLSRPYRKRTDDEGLVEEQIGLQAG